MKHLISLIFLQAVFLLTSPHANCAGRVDDYRFFSKALNREMTCRVYLPEAYEPDNPGKSFPVIYFLHGASLGYDSDLYWPLFGLLDNLIALTLIKPVILVLPDGLAPPYKGSFYTNSALYGNFEDYISQDLIAFTDSAFHTKAERGKRAIMGASMGAYGALKIAFKHQEMFIGVAGHSGPVNTEMLDIFIPDLITEDGGVAPYHWSPGPGKELTTLTFTMAGAFSPNLNNPYLVDFPLDSLAKPIPEVMSRWRTENICEIAKVYLPGTNLGITFDCGILDDYYLYFQNRAFADTLTKYNISHNYVEYVGNHISGLPVRVTLSLVYFDKLFLADDASGIPMTGEKNWEVYPNPTINTLTISNNHNISGGRTTLQVSDGAGRIMLDQLLNDGKNCINITSLPAGMYFYRIRSGKTVQTGKTMIVR